MLHFAPELTLAGLARLVAQQPIDTFRHEPRLPGPHHRFGFKRPLSSGARCNTRRPWCSLNFRTPRQLTGLRNQAQCRENWGPKPNFRRFARTLGVLHLASEFTAVPGNPKRTWQRRANPLLIAPSHLAPESTWTSPSRRKMAVRSIFWRRKDEFNSFWHGEHLCPTVIACLNSFGSRGFRVNLYTYGPVEGIPKFVRIRDAERIVKKDNLFFAHDGVQNFSDIFRYQLLKKLGGWWIDTDVVCNARVVSNANIAFAEIWEGYFGNGQLKFPKNHPLILELLDDMNHIDAHSGFCSTGPDALTSAIKKNTNIEVYKWKTHDFYPISWVEFC